MVFNLHLLRVFYQVCETGRFSAAAEQLYISQPAVSKNVKELEHQLGVSLIDRSHKKTALKLTQAGQRMYQHARGIFALERAALTDLAALRGLTSGTLKIGASSTVAGYLLNQQIAIFQAANPELDIQVQVGNTETICNGLIDCHIELAFVEGETSDKRLTLLPWRDDELVFIQPAKSKQIAQKQLQTALWLVREDGSGTRTWSNRVLESCAIQVQRKMIFGSNEAIVNAVAQGLGVAVVPCVVAQALIRLGEVKVFYPDSRGRISRPLYIVTHQGRPLSPSAKAFYQLAQK